jgi:hypothetical protein
MATWEKDWDKMHFINDEEEIDDSQVKVFFFILERSQEYLLCQTWIILK